MLDFDINWLAALVGAAVGNLVVGSVWYSPVLFSRVWQREVGISDVDIRSSNFAIVFGLAFALSVVAAVLFAAWLGPDPELGDALVAALVIGLGFVGTSLGINYLFERKSFLLWAINTGFHTMEFVVIGLVLGLWH
ncbi:MAG: DUF1761 domain-containing protein [Bauldia sp.]|jgi:hypothetical protein|nr:DUF1761 domain-containing protein [Bauldia sp.]